MKLVTAKATYSDVAERLFGTRESARETARQVLETRGVTKVVLRSGSYTVRTERGNPLPAPGKARK